jgi:hypothetical protein
MKYLLILLFALSTAGQSVKERVKTFDNPKSYKVEYDKFQKLTKVTVRIGRPVQMIAFAYIPDDGEHSFALYFSSLYLYNNHTLRFLLDGEVLEIPTDQIEYSILVPISPDEMNRIVNAKSVEVQIAQDEGKLSADTLKKLKNLTKLR